jgi:hypothetical protein
MTPWSDWTPDVAIDVTGCPAPTIERAVKQTVIDFCERTHWVKRTAAPIDVAGGAAARTFGSPVIVSGEAVLAILKAWLSDEPLEVYGPDDVDEDWPDWKTRTGDPECIVYESIDTYYVVPAPVATMTAALRLKVAVGYTDAATGCDDTIRQHWRDAISDGAKARLMSMPEKQWSSPDHAGMHQQLYLAATKGASIRAIRSPARRPLVTKPYWF